MIENQKQKKLNNWLSSGQAVTPPSRAKVYRVIRTAKGCRVPPLRVAGGSRYHGRVLDFQILISQKKVSILESETN
jgi:hypothetical protein